ncbi:MAG: PolC-type DNA polymerase III [Clostridiales bacterium]|nr:PolC-type DNA polymerase III [Clostridiales bacterium]
MGELVEIVPDREAFPFVEALWVDPEDGRVWAVLTPGAGPSEVEALKEKLKASLGVEVEFRVRAEEAAEIQPKKKARRASRGKAVALSEVQPGMGRVQVEGRLFDWERESRQGKGWLHLFITDETDSLMLRLEENGEPLPELQRDAWVRAWGTVPPEGRLKEKDPVLLVEGLEMEPPVIRPDEAPVKRVELHVHTRMSAMAALTDPQALLERAKAWGHEAVAITDHGVVQAFPAAMEAAEKLGIKLIYGMEAYVVDESPPPEALRGLALPLDGPFVSVDLETTGLSPRGHRIIEVGAVRWEGGTPQETFQRLVRLEGELAAEVTRLTGLRAEDLVKAPPLREVLEDFLAFAGHLPLVAHNAAFDVGFLYRAAREELGVDYRPPVLDTLWLARAFMGELTGHGLASLARALGVPLKQHHRALDDAETAGGVFLKLLERAGRKGTWKDLLEAAGKETFRGLRPYHVTLLARSEKGLENLYRLVTASHVEHFYRVPRIPKSLLQAHREGLLVGAAGCSEGELLDAWLTGEPEEQWKGRLSFYDYVELSPLDTLGHLIPQYVGSLDILKAYHRELVAAAREAAVPAVAVGDVHYLDPRDEVGRAILLHQGRGSGEKPGSYPFRTTGEMLEAFSYLGEDDARQVVVEAPLALARSIPPLKALPDGLHAPHLPEAEEELGEQVYRRARELYGDPLPEPVARRLEDELSAIRRHGYATLYVLAARLVRRSLEDGYLVGSRGSVGSSLVATLLGITEVNPLPPHYRCPECRYTEFVADPEVGSGFDLPEKACPRCGSHLVGDGHDIPFASFLGFDGEKVPDIDLNFSGEYQAQAHQHAEALLGRQYVVRAGTVSTIAERTAYGFCRSWAEAQGKELRAAELRRLSLLLVGVKRTTGQHPGGLMLFPQGEDIHRFTPLQWPANDPSSRQMTTHFDYDAISGRLVKLDLLGHDDPTTLKRLQELTGVDPREVPFQDEKTRRLFWEDPEGKGAMGLPEFGTRFVRGMLAQTRPRTFAELVRISGLSHGTDVWANNGRDLVESGTATLKELISTREDIYLYLAQRGMDPRQAFEIGERVRKGKGLRPEDREAMEALGVPRWYIDSAAKITYLFPKAHAVAYVMMAFRIAWFKVHHPLAFYAAYFSSNRELFDGEWLGMEVEEWRKRLGQLERGSSREMAQATVLEVALEMAEKGFRFFPVDLERSHAVEFLPVEEGGVKGLLPPFAVVAGLGEKSAWRLVEAREEAAFTSRLDLQKRAGLSRSVVETLAAQGVLRNLPEDNQLSFLG